MARSASEQIQEGWGWLAPEETASSSEPKMPEMPAYRSARKMKRYEQDMKQFAAQQAISQQRLQEDRYQQNMDRQFRMEELAQTRENRMFAQAENEMETRKRKEADTLEVRKAGAEALAKLGQVKDRDAMRDLISKVPAHAWSDIGFVTAFNAQDDILNKAEQARIKYTPQQELQADIVAAGGDINFKDGNVYRNDPQLGNVKIGSLMDADGKIDPVSAAYVLRELGAGKKRDYDLNPVARIRGELQEAQTVLSELEKTKPPIDIDGQAKHQLKVIEARAAVAGATEKERIYREARPDLFDAKPTTPDAPDIPELTSKEEFDKLPSGATYKRNGKTYRKP